MKVSVCMASYNGERYIQRQIESILPQLAEEDELLIVDDFSTDRTVEIIKALKDDRIRVHCNFNNLGFLKSFEKAIYLSSGDIIFLSDQDDIWLENKISAVLQCFDKEHAEIVFHDAFVVDQDLKIIYESFQDLRNIQEKPWGNFIFNSFTGCCMAFSKAVKEYALPIPSMAGYHDRWIGIWGGLGGFSVKFLSKKLIYYVRHSNNVSPLEKRGVFVIIKDRLKLLCAILFAFIRHCRENKVIKKI